jgi:preprotein translocase SecE subunit
MDNLSQYLRETVVELKQVKWPTQNQALIYTALIIGVCVTLGIFVGLLDFGLSSAINMLVTKFK